jgi:hypothetical protein
LHAALVEADLAGHIRRDGQGRLVFAVGARAGEPLEHVAAEDPPFLRRLVDGHGLLEDARELVLRALAGQPSFPDAGEGRSRDE